MEELNASKVSFSSWRGTFFWFLVGKMFVFNNFNSADAFVTNGSLSHRRWKPHSKIIQLHSSSSSKISEEVDSNNDDNQQWKEELLHLCQRTKGGFEATSQDRRQIERLIEQQQMNKDLKLVIETAIQEYYEGKETSFLRGKWDLLYTDAPDILSLQTSSFLPTNPLAPQLGRIGQDCTNPPIIENVIEWKKPSTTTNLLPSFLSSLPERILQKVSCRGSYDKNNSKLDNQVNLSILGARLEMPSNSSSSSPTPLITLPFGSFQILYIDSEIRITKTSQNYYAINRRSKDPWF